MPSDAASVGGAAIFFVAIAVSFLVLFAAF
jgi:hypothetical protein